MNQQIFGCLAPDKIVQQMTSSVHMLMHTFGASVQWICIAPVECTPRLLHGLSSHVINTIAINQFATTVPYGTSAISEQNAKSAKTHPAETGTIIKQKLAKSACQKCKALTGHDAWKALLKAQPTHARAIKTRATMTLIKKNCSIAGKRITICPAEQTKHSPAEVT